MSLARAFHVGPLRLELSGLERLEGRSRAWVETAVADLPSAADDSQGPTLRIDFVPELVAGGPVPFDPVGHADGGVTIVDQAGRVAVLPLPDPTTAAVRVDARMNAYVFEEWVLLPALRLAVEAAGGDLVRAAGVALDGRVVVVAAPMRTGKTRLVLELLRRGGRYLGDDYLVLDPDGLVHPALTRITLRDTHRGQLGEDWPGGTSTVRRLATRGLSFGARVTASRYPALSVGFARLATAGWVLGFEAAPASALAPAGVGEPGPITDLVFLCPPSMPLPRREDVPTVVAGLGELDARPNATLAAAHTTLHPGAAPTRFRPAEDVADALRKATEEARIVVVAAEGDWLDAAVEDVLTGSTT